MGRSKCQYAIKETYTGMFLLVLFFSAFINLSRLYNFIYEYLASGTGVSRHLQ